MSDDQTKIFAMPYCDSLEKTIVSMMIHFPEVRDELPDVKSDHFYGIAAREIYMSLLNGKNDVQDIAIDLINRGVMDKIGGPSSLHEVYLHCQGTKQGFQSKFSELNSYLVRRMAIEAGNAMIETAISEHSTQEIESAIGAPITAISDQINGAAKDREMPEIVSDTMETIKARLTHRVPSGIQTTIEKFNTTFKGLHAGHTIIISGYPGSGKSMLALQMAIDSAKQGHRTMVFTYEMTDTQLTERAISYLGRIELGKITMPDCDEEVTKANLLSIRRAAEELVKMPMNIRMSAGWHVGKIISAIRKMHRRSPVRVVVVDYVQLIPAHPDFRRESREQQLAHASNMLAAVAKELGITIIIPSQLNKDGAAKHAEAINEAADIHLKIKQTKTETEVKWEGVYIAKDRHCGREGFTLLIALNGQFCRFDEMQQP